MAIDIKELTLGQIEQLKSILGSGTASVGERTVHPVGQKVILRARDAGCHYGELVAKLGPREVAIKNSRRLWKFVGCETLSELAVYGAKKPGECRFAPKICDTVSILDVCEIIPVTVAAADMIEAVPEWKQ